MHRINALEVFIKAIFLTTDSNKGMKPITIAFFLK